jgi:hypothetical protein
MLTAKVEKCAGDLSRPILEPTGDSFMEDTSAHGDCTTAGNWVLNEHLKSNRSE